MANQSEDRSGEIRETGYSTDGGYWMCCNCYSDKVLVSPATNRTLPVCPVCGGTQWLWVMSCRDNSAK